MDPGFDLRLRVTLTPAPLKVDRAAVIHPIRAGLVGLDAAPGAGADTDAGSWRFDWTCTARYGDLYKQLLAGADEREKNRFCTTAGNATCDYVARQLADAEAAPESITVRAWFEPGDNTRPAVLVGEATCAVAFRQPFTLSLSPGAGHLPAHADVPLQAFFNEPLPPGATVEWIWTHGGAGALALPAEEAAPTLSHACLKTGHADGAATVKVKARVHLPPVGAAPARTVSAAEIVARYAVRTGVRSFQFDAAEGVFACADAAGGYGVDRYTAFIVPVFARAIGYRSEHVAAGGRVLRVENWTAPKPDRGGNSFPITRHPLPAGLSHWAVWTGFGSAPDAGLRCRVTVSVA